MQYSGWPALCLEGVCTSISFALAGCRKRSKAVDWDTVEATPAMNSWEATPGATPAAHWEATPGATPAAHWDATPGATPGAGSRWDATPTPGRSADGATPRRNRWDETPTPGRVSPGFSLSHCIRLGRYSCCNSRRGSQIPTEPRPCVACVPGTMNCQTYGCLSPLLYFVVHSATVHQPKQMALTASCSSVQTGFWNSMPLVPSYLNPAAWSSTALLSGPF